MKKDSATMKRTDDNGLTLRQFHSAIPIFIFLGVLIILFLVAYPSYVRVKKKAQEMSQQHSVKSLERRP